MNVVEVVVEVVNDQQQINNMILLLLVLRDHVNLMIEVSLTNYISIIYFYINMCFVYIGAMEATCTILLKGLTPKTTEPVVSTYILHCHLYLKSVFEYHS
jgi:hypothetical protein